jgi:hypothetical protein
MDHFEVKDMLLFKNEIISVYSKEYQFNRLAISTIQTAISQ